MPAHEKIFNEICTKLNELSQVEDHKSSKDKVAQLTAARKQLLHHSPDEEHLQVGRYLVCGDRGHTRGRG